MVNSKLEGYVIDPGQDWDVDLFRPEDAEGVAGLFLSVYGEGYPIKTYLEPERLIRENAAGRTISSVARTPKGDIVGHNAIFRSAPYDRIYESGGGVVHASYRGGKGVFTRLVAHGVDVGAEAFGIEAVYAESVCNHVFSQKLCHGLGFATMAAEVDLMPASAYEQEKSAPGRVASVLDFKTIRPKPHQVFLPGAYEEALRYIYSGLDDQRELLISTDASPARSSTLIKTQYFDFAQVARLAVWDAGVDFAQVLDQEEKGVKEKGAIIIQVWLNLSQPWVGQAAEILMLNGYFLGGLLPRWFDGDGLLMQKIMKQPDWEGIQLHFDRAKQILALVKSDWARTQRRTTA